MLHYSRPHTMATVPYAQTRQKKKMGKLTGQIELDS